MNIVPPAVGDRYSITAAAPPAPKGGSNLEVWARYFGPPAYPIQTNPYDKYAVETYDLPEAYKGRNLFLRTQIDNLIRQGSDWYTAVALPWKQTNDIHIAWNEWHFSSTLAGRVPHEGVSRLVSSSKRAFKDHVVRRGLAMILEHGFMNTPEGEEQYIRNLVGIRQCVQETCNYDVIHAYLTCRNYDREYNLKRNPASREVAEELMDREVALYGIVQKSETGMDILHEELKARFARYGVDPNMWIFPPRLMMYLTMVPPSKTEHYLGGDKAVERFEQGPAARTSFRGIDVYETRPFEVNENELPVDLLVRPQQVGEYYRMFGPDVALCDPASYRTDCRDIIVYDEKRDNWARVPFVNALENALQIDYQTYRASGLFKRSAGPDAATVGELMGAMDPSSAQKIEEIVRAGVPAAGAAKAVEDYRGMKIGTAFDLRATLKRLAEENLPVPFGILLFRPFITHYTASAIMTVKGEATGNTFVGHSDFQLGDDVATKLHYGNFTFYSKAIVTNPKNVMIAENVYLQGYVGGNNAKFFESKERFREFIQESDYDIGSMFACLVPYATDDLEKRIDLLNDARSGVAALRTHYELVANGLFSTDPRASQGLRDADMFLNAALRYNSVCYQGHQFIYRQKPGGVGDHDAVIQNTGHLGPDVYPGVGRVRAGTMKYVVPQNYGSNGFVSRAIAVAK